MATQRTEVSRPKGINKDLSPYELPPEIWSGGYNITFRRHRTNALKGYGEIGAFTLTEAPTYTQYFTFEDTDGYIYASESSVYTTTGASDTLVGTGYSASRQWSWTGCNLNGVTIMNNRLNVPQVLNPETNAEMIDLPFWNVVLDRAEYPTIEDEEFQALDIWGENSRCEVIRPYKNYLLALDCYDANSVHYPLMIRWSSGADAGDVPPSWSPYDPNERAGLYSLSDSPGRLLDGKTLGDYFMIYKSDSVWTAQFVGGDLVFNFRKLFGQEGGILSKDCVAEFEGKHFVLTSNGAYIHNASTMQEIMEKWVKDELFDNVDSNFLLETKVIADHTNKEIWIYYVSTESATSWADKAVIWNWDTKEWSARELTGISYISEGRIDLNPVAATANAWDTLVTTWDTTPSYWDDGVQPLNAKSTRLMLSDYVNKKLYANELSDTQLGLPLNSYVERIGIDFDNDESYKYVTRVVPHLRDNSVVATPVTVSILVEDTMESAAVWTSIGDFTPGLTHSLDCHMVGRYIGVKFEGEGVWDLTGYTIEWEPAGTY